MKGLREFPQIFIYRPFVDMRKQMLGLSTMIQEQMGKSPFDVSLYVFCNRRRDLIKCIYWDRTGFAMWVKKLDQDRFVWPKNLSNDVIALSPKSMEWLLEGYDIWKMRAHKSLRFEKVL